MSSKRLNTSWPLSCSANPSNSKEGSSSCQCTVTLIGVKTTKKPVKQMLIESPSTLVDFSEDIGHSWCLDVNKNGTGLTSTNLMEMGFGRRQKSEFAERQHPIFRASSSIGKRRVQKQRRSKEIHSLQRYGSDANTELTFSHNSFRQSAQYLRSSRGSPC